MTGRLAHIVRHPIKSVGWETLDKAELSPGAVLPGDRHWAIAHVAAAFDGQPEGWHAKRNFVRGVAAPALMAVRARMDEAQSRLTLSHPSAGTIDVAPDDPADARRLVDWVGPMWPETRPRADRVVRARGQAMTDVPSPFVSVLSVASLADLGQRMGLDLSIHRFRGNLWIDGVEAWAEQGWVGQEITIGGARLRIEQPITRCNATKADPETGQVAGDTLAALEAAFGHREFGVYATVIDGGAIRCGDPVEVA